MMTLRRAVEWCGGIDALGDALNTTAESLERWLSGEEEVPSAVRREGVRRSGGGLGRGGGGREGPAGESRGSGLVLGRRSICDCCGRGRPHSERRSIKAGQGWSRLVKVNQGWSRLIKVGGWFLVEG